MFRIFFLNKINVFFIIYLVLSNVINIVCVVVSS